MSLVPLLLFLILAPLNTHAATLSGFVTDASNGETLPYASVRIEGTALGVFSNNNGYYAFKYIPAGTVTIVVTYIGYESRRETVVLVGDEARRLDIALRSRVIDIEETVVEADRYKEEKLVQPGFLNLQAATLRDLPSLGESDLLRGLQLLPGIKASSDISSGLYIRGGGPDQTQILLDQIPLYNPSHAFGFFSTFNPDAIKDLSLHKGAYPAQYGGNLGAVLDVTNRDGNRNRIQGTGGISVIVGRMTLEGPVYKGSWMVSGRRTYLEPILNAIRSKSTEIPNYYFYDLNTKISQELSRSDKLVISGYFGRDDLDFDLDTGSFVRVRWGNAAVTGKWTHVFSPTLFGNFLVASSSYVSRTSLSFFETPFLFRNSIRDISVKGDLDYFAGAKHTLNAGFRATRYDFSFQQAFNQQEQLDLTRQPYLFSLYAQDLWQALPVTTVRMGLRVTHFTERKTVDIEPRLSVSHYLTENLRVKTAAGVYHQYLQLITTEGFSGGDFWVPLDSTVTPGRSWQTVTGLEWEPSERYSASIEGYYTGLSHLVMLDNTTTVDGASTRSKDIFKTDGKGYASGVELFLQRRTGAVTGWIGYTLGLTRRKFAGLNGGKAFPPKYDRRHDVTFVAKYRRGKWTFGTDFIYGTGQAFTPAAARYTLRSPATGVEEDYILPAERNSARLLPYHRLDLNITRDFKLFGHNAQWFVQVFNVYSRRNEWFVQYNTDDPATAPEVVKMLPVIPTLGVNYSF
ncbi:MAG: TonB-dependent receptor [candidate division Zixibacteria bacterium]|nr:TonB-dependent receptor [candidate division Zixibacteria bacterium]